MGSSIAAAAKKANPGIKIKGFDIDGNNLAFCLKNKLIDSKADLSELSGKGKFSGEELIILCIPPASILNILKDRRHFFEKAPLITDIASIKGFLFNDKKPIRSLLKNFVGSHPMCGSDKSGPENFDPGLFKSKQCIVIKEKRDLKNPERMKKIEGVSSFWRMLGMEVFYSSPAFHDIMASYTSHLPHLVSFALSGTVTKKILMEKANNSEAFIGTGFRDSTRIADSSHVLWSDIFINNKENVLSSLDDFIHFLDTLKKIIRKGDTESLESLLKAVSEEREGIYDYHKI